MDTFEIDQEAINEADSVGLPHHCSKCGGRFVANSGQAYSDPAGYLLGAGLHSEGRC
jgi:hypothetical protein